MKEKIREFICDEHTVIGMTIMFISLVIAISLAYAIGYKSGNDKANEEAAETISRVMYETEYCTLRDTIGEIERIVNDYNNCSRVFNTTGDYNNYDEMWLSIRGYNVRCLNLYGRLWMSIEDDTSKWGKKER